MVGIDGAWAWLLLDCAWDRGINHTKVEGVKVDRSEVNMRVSREPRVHVGIDQLLNQRDGRETVFPAGQARAKPLRNRFTDHGRLADRKVSFYRLSTFSRIVIVMVVLVFSVIGPFVQA
jgi:hypothetical protein